MSKYLIAICLLTISTKALNARELTPLERIYNLEVEVNRLTAESNQSTQQITELINNYNALREYCISIANTPVQAQFSITKIDSFFRYLYVNDVSYRYFNGARIEHWQNGQAIVFKKGKKKGNLTIHNQDLNESIQAKKDSF